MSKRVTKAMAKDAAAELTVIAYDQMVEKARNDLRDFVDGLYVKYVPAPIRAMSEEYEESLYMVNNITIISDKAKNSWDYTTAITTKTHAQLSRITIADSDWREYIKLKRAVANIENDREKYCEDVTNALIALSTESRIKEHFPEALPYLNFSGATTLSPNYDNLRVQLRRKK